MELVEAFWFLGPMLASLGSAAGAAGLSGLSSALSSGASALGGLGAAGATGAAGAGAQTATMGGLLANLGKGFLGHMQSQSGGQQQPQMAPPQVSKPQMMPPGANMESVISLLERRNRKMGL